MAQTTSSTTNKSPRPLPRRERPSQMRATRPRLQPLDGLWIILLAGLAAALFGVTAHGQVSMPVLLSCGAASLTVALVYLLGWRVRDRTTGVVAGLLLATSLSFLQGAVEAPKSVLLALLTAGAMLAFASDFSLAALTLAGLATVVQPDAALLGVVLLVFSFAQHRRRAGVGAVLYFLIALGGSALLLVLGQNSSHAIHRGINPWLRGAVLSSGSVFLLWFLLPFLGEWRDRVRRSRWLPIVSWLILYSLTATVVHIGNAQEIALPFLPLFFVIVAGGFSRLLPILAGEFVSLPMRYGVATAGALVLIAMRASQEWQQVYPQSLSAPNMVAYAPRRPLRSIPNPQPVSKPSPPATSSETSFVPKPPQVKTSNSTSLPSTQDQANQAVLSNPDPAKIPPPMPGESPSGKSVVQSYRLVHGRRVRRSRWAISWHLKHPSNR
jgi:hypothetical protein